MQTLGINKNEMKKQAENYTILMIQMLNTSNEQTDREEKADVKFHLLQLWTRCTFLWGSFLKNTR